MRRISVTALAAAGALAVVGAALAYGGMPGSPRMGGGMSNGMMAGPVDGAAASRHFIEMMIPHHEDAVAMAQLAMQKGERAEVRTLAAAIAKTQADETAQMRAWYREWYGGEVTAVTMPRHMGGGVESLAGAQSFDKAFLAEMIGHHAMGLRMITKLQARVDRPQLAGLMKTMSQTQRKEIAQMRSWYASWYGETPRTGGTMGMGAMGGMGMMGGRGPGACMNP